MNLHPNKRVLVVTAVPAERDAVLRGLNGDPRFDVLAMGVGPAAAAAGTARALAAANMAAAAMAEEPVATGYGLVVSAGIGGGFPGRAEVGSLVVASEIIAADLGAETPEGFCSVAELGFGAICVQVDAALVSRVSDALLAAGLPVCTGPVLTVSTVTGTAASAAEMTARVPGAAAEAMEGYGVAIAAQDSGVPVLELRAISNLVGPRDRTAWRIKEALDVLTAAGAVLAEVL
jgi:futalosine hydrolase